MTRVLLLAILAFAVTAVCAAPSQTFRLKDYLSHTWTDELISYPLAPELAKVAVLQVTDEAGKAVPYQVQGGRVYFLVTLPADGEKSFAVSAGRTAASPPQRVKIKEEDALLTLDAGVLAVRLPAGKQEFRRPVAADTVPGPLQGIRGETGAWIGKSWLQAPLRVTGYTTTVSASGPLFAEATVDYAFEGGKHYRFTLRAIAGQPTVIVDEEMDLNPGGKYSIASYSNDADASTWEWWWIDAAENVHPATVYFSFYSGLEPNQCRWTGHHATHPRKGTDAEGKIMTNGAETTAVAYARLTYEQDEMWNRVSGWWTNSFGDRSNEFIFYNDRQPDTPVISLSRGRPSRNLNPQITPVAEPWVKITTALNDLRVWTRKDPDLQVLAPICLGTRQWLLSVEPQSVLVPPGTPQMSSAYRAMLKYAYFPLEKVKDWTFDWPEPQNAWPRLFCKAGDLQAMRERVAAASGQQAANPNIPAVYRAQWTTDDVIKQVLAPLKQKVDDALSGTGHGGINWFHASLHMMQFMPLWEGAMATPGLDPAVRARIKAYGAFLAHRAWDDDYWPPKPTGNGWGSANMGILAAGARVLTACAMAGHPRSAEWVKRCRGYLDGNLQGLLASDGSGLSCPHYLGASVDPVMYMALALKYGGGYDVFKIDPRMARFGQFMIDLLTPPDPRSPIGGPFYGLPLGAPLDPNAVNRRNLWPLGHTSRTETTGILDMLALGYAGVNEPLAGALRSMAAEMGGNSGSGFVAYALLSNASSPLVQPDLRSRWYPAYGAFLRDRQPQETWLAVRYSRFAFDHFQSDMGAFTLFGRGVPLMMDFGPMYSPENGQAVYHNRIAWNVQEGPQKPCPGNGGPGCFYQGLTYFEHQFEPWTDQVEAPGTGMGILDHYGEIKTFSSLPEADYLLGQVDVKALETESYFPDTPVGRAADPTQPRKIKDVEPFSWLRRMMMVKATEPEQPAYLLVRDDFSAPCPPATASYWVMANDLQFAGNQAHATGQFEVDLDLFCAQPAQPQFSQWAWEHKNWGGERQLCVRISQAEGKPFLVLLYPRKAGEPQPKFETIADGNGVKLSYGEESADYVFLGDGPVSFKSSAEEAGSAGPLQFEAPAGWLRLNHRTRVLTVCLPAGGTATAAGLTLRAEGPVAMTLDAQGGVFHTSGAKQTLSVSGKLPAGQAATLDGKPLAVAEKKGWTVISVPAGEHEIIVR